MSRLLADRVGPCSAPERPGVEPDPSLAGDAAALAERYSQKLSLRLENGEVVPVNEVQARTIDGVK